MKNPLPKAAVFDMDDSLVRFRHWYIPAARQTARDLHAAGFQIIILTCRRKPLFYLSTLFCLSRLGVPHRLIMYPRLWRSGPPSYKGEEMEKLSREFDIHYFFEDRPAMHEATARWVRRGVLVDHKQWPDIAAGIRAEIGF